MLTRSFWADLGERAVRTAAQTAVGLVPATLTGLVALDWRGALVAIGGATLAAVLTALAAAPVADAGTASFLSAPAGQSGRHES